MEQRHHVARTPNFARAQQLLSARVEADPDRVARTEEAIAVDMLGADVALEDMRARATCYSRHRDLTAFAATEAFANALSAAIADALAVSDIKTKQSKYDLLFATPTMFKDLWVTRQVADSLGVQYDFYAQQAVSYWFAQGHGRSPRPSQLRDAHVVRHVIEAWSMHQLAAHDIAGATDSVVASEGAEHI